jgi:homoserine kinase
LRRGGRCRSLPADEESDKRNGFNIIMNKKVTVQVPATSANLGPGFDILGIALHWFNDVAFEGQQFINGTHKSVRSLAIDIEGEGADLLPRNDSNLVAKAACKVFEKAKRWPTLLHIRLTNRIPLSRGLGSSAAATLGGMAAANALIGKPLKGDEILEMAVHMEGHPDNIVPAFVGGLCVSGLFSHKTWYYKLKTPVGLRAVVCSPAKPLATSHARRVLPSQIPFNAAVFTASRVAFLLGALTQKKYEWLGQAQEDVLHQPARAKLIPGLMDAIREAKKAGAYGAALSGAGSSVMAFVKPGLGKSVGPAMQRVFAAHNIPSTWVEVPFENRGTRVR